MAKAGDEAPRLFDPLPPQHIHQRAAYHHPVRHPRDLCCLLGSGDAEADRHRQIGERADLRDLTRQVLCERLAGAGDTGAGDVVEKAASTGGDLAPRDSNEKWSIGICTGTTLLSFDRSSSKW